MDFSIHKLITKFRKSIFRRLAGDHQIFLEEMPDSPSLFKIYRNLIVTGHRRVPGGWIYDNEFYPDYLTVGGNSFFIKGKALKYCNGKGLDIGASFWPLPGSTPIDNELGPGLINKLINVPENSQDYLFSSHCLEHIENWEEVLSEWCSKIKTGGMIFLYLPHPSCKLWHMSNPQMKETHKWIPTPEIIKKELSLLNFDIIAFDDGPDTFYSFFTCAKKR